MNDAFKPAGQPNTTTRASLLKLNQPLQRTNHGQKNIPYIAPIIWNSPNPDYPTSLKTTNNLNTYKYRVKEHFFHRIKRESNNIYSYFCFFFNVQPLFIFIAISIFIIITLLL